MLRTPSWPGQRRGFLIVGRDLLTVADILYSLNVATWNSLPLFSKICFAAAAVGLVLYIVLVIRGRLFGGDAKKNLK
jgi:hypothetical protein